MQTKHLCVLIHIWTKGEVGAPLNRYKPSSKIFFRPFQGGASFVDLLYVFFCLVFGMPLYLSVHMCLVVTCWERADLLALVCGVLLWVCYFPIRILGQVWYLIVSIPDLCTLTYFYYCKDIIFIFIIFFFLLKYRSPFSLIWSHQWQKHSLVGSVKLYFNYRLSPLQFLRYMYELRHEISNNVAFWNE